MRAQGFHGGASVLPIQAVHRVERREGAGAPYLLTVGVQNRHKNLARLVQAWDLADTGDFELRICARPGNAAREFEEALERSTKRQSVRVVGGLSQDEYLAMLGECHAYVQPSLYEGLGIPLLDVAAAGIPVIGSELGNTGSVLEPSEVGLTFDPLRPDEMARAIERVLHDAAYREAASQWQMQNIAMTDWRAVAQAAIG
nr:glycosyltransferase [Aeromicrobium duanguangcaii]